MTQKTLDKLNRAIKALEIASESMARDTSLAVGRENQAESFVEYEKYITMVSKIKSFRDNVETGMYLTSKEERA